MAKKPRTERRFRGVRMPTASHPAIRRLKRQGIEPSIHGNKLWKSSCLLIDYLKKHPPEHRKRVIDVGCGWGISGIWCAQQFGSKVTSVDADPDVFPFLQATADINGVETRERVSRFEKLSTRASSFFFLSPFTLPSPGSYYIIFSASLVFHSYYSFSPFFSLIPYVLSSFFLLCASFLPA